MHLQSEATAEGQNRPLSDSEALGGENCDEKCLRRLSAPSKTSRDENGKGNIEEASKLYSEAAEGAMNGGKIQSAAQWSALADQ